MIRLVATDLDGTLLRSDGDVSQRTIRAVRSVQAAGIEVVPVTARAPQWIVGIAASIGLEGHAVCSNGALVYDIGDDRIVDTHVLASELATRIVSAMRDAAPGVAFACERESLAIREPAYQPLWAIPDMHPRMDALEFVRLPVSKLLAQHPELPQAELHAIAERICGADATATISGERLVEISAAGVTKAFAVERLCEQLGVDSEEVLAFGDMPNDIPLLHWAGRSVAVANAHPDVIEAADEITASNDDDGVAAVLERLRRSLRERRP